MRILYLNILREPLIRPQRLLQESLLLKPKDALDGLLGAFLLMHRLYRRLNVTLELRED